ncbi:hypothetical protein E3N88_35654 [Mikania micrantha]|uniref:Uncharacterized protein n=1 Tax=Mikania micrantha TaxID=192012 RepID=A0A5N6M1I3_9ASTR|nr:hypothetical protein E3N88_35654 [Mikania micrantha]
MPNNKTPELHSSQNSGGDSPRSPRSYLGDRNPRLGFRGVMFTASMAAITVANESKDKKLHLDCPAKIQKLRFWADSILSSQPPTFKESPANGKRSATLIHET